MTEPSNRPTPAESAARRRRLAVITDNARFCVALLGAQHSGIELCRRALAVLGVHAREGSEPAGAPNPDVAPIEVLNSRILSVFDRDQETPFHDLQLPNAWWADTRLRPLERELGQVLGTYLDRRGSFLLADPQMSRLLPVWRPALRDLEITLKTVICLRDPGQVAGALAAKEGLPRDTGEARWLTYMVDILKGLEGLEPCVIEYETWFREPRKNLLKLRQFLGLAADQSDPELDNVLAGIIDPIDRPERFDRVEARLPLVRSLYELLRRWTEDAAARDEIMSTVDRIVLYREINRPFEREFEKVSRLYPGEGSPSVVSPADGAIGAAGSSLAGTRALVRVDNAEPSAALRFAAVGPRLWRRLFPWRRIGWATRDGVEPLPLRGELRERETRLAQEVNRLEADIMELREEAEAAASRLAAAHGELAAERGALAAANERIEEELLGRQEAVARLATAEVSVARLEYELTEAKSLTEKYGSELGVLRRELHDRNMALAAAEETSAEHRAGRAHLESRLAERSAALSEAESMLGQHEQALLRFQQDLVSRDLELDELRAALIDRDDALAGGHATSASLQADIASRDLEMAELRATLTARDAALAGSQTESATLRAVVTAVEERLAEREQVLATTVDEITLLKAELPRAEAEIAALQEAMAGAEAERTRLHTAVETAQAQLAEREHLLANAAREMASLQAEVEALGAVVREREAAMASFEAAAADHEAETAATVDALHVELAEREAALTRIEASAAEEREVAAALAAALRDKLETREAEFTALVETLAGAVRETEELRTRLAAAEAALDLAKRDAEDKNATSRARMLALLKERAARGAALVEANRRAEEVMIRMEKVEAEAAGRDAALAQLQGIVESRNAAAEDARAQVIALQAELTALRGELTRQKASPKLSRGTAPATTRQGTTMVPPPASPTRRTDLDEPIGFRE
ncbi:MAG TPA: hypothetical protein VMF86_06995 [Stellaceae bacterium]|nr:hypothetical protein [Stellaceae bacterium]